MNSQNSWRRNPHKHFISLLFYSGRYIKMPKSFIIRFVKWSNSVHLYHQSVRLLLNILSAWTNSWFLTQSHTTIIYLKTLSALRRLRNSNVRIMKERCDGKRSWTSLRYQIIHLKRLRIYRNLSHYSRPPSRESNPGLKNTKQHYRGPTHSSQCSTLGKKELRLS
jgi:hypothetical protein